MPKLNKQQIEAIAAQGFNLYQQGKLDEAKVIFEGLTAIDSTNYMGYAGLGAVALAKEPPQLDAALANLQKAAEINPSDPSVHANLGEALLRQPNSRRRRRSSIRLLNLIHRERIRAPTGPVPS